jgi:hypothetical protein
MSYSYTWISECIVLTNTRGLSVGSAAPVDLNELQFFLRDLIWNLVEFFVATGIQLVIQKLKKEM